ncbi:MAG: hypothetical protein F4053_09585 [Proteobacteria bacterium]|nr:hypothetical protein [Pseudomonadota bacterium]
MGTPIARRWLDRRKLTEFGFGSVAALCLLGFLGLYVVYGVSAFLRLGDHIPLGERAIMVVGPSTVAIAFLVAPAVFAASAIRFDLLTARESAVRRVYWGQLVLGALCAYLLWATGPLAARSMLPVVIDPPPESFMPFRQALASLSLLSPVSCALFVMVSGIAGALIGRVAATSVWNGARASQWVACLGLMVAFWAPYHYARDRILQDGISVAWIVLAPLSLPVFLTGALALREFGSRLRPLRLPSLKSDPQDVAGAEQDNDIGLSMEDAVIARRIRSLVGTRATLSQPQIDEIVTALSNREEPLHEPGAHGSAKRAESLGEFCAAWTCLTTGFLIVASLGGLLRDFPVALLAGLAGSIGVMLILRAGTREAVAGSLPV